MFYLEETDCIVVAGGNATLNEVISGLVNRENAAANTNRNERGSSAHSSGLRIPPIGIVPVGLTNTFAHKWLNMLGLSNDTEAEIRLLATSALSIIKGDTIDANLIKVILPYCNSDDFIRSLKR